MPVYDANGKLREWVGTCTDITEQRATEAALHDSQEKFRQLADNITDVFWVCSHDYSKVLYVSPGYELIWGRTAESLYANPHQWVEAILPGERARVLACFAPVFADAPSAAVEYRIARPDGSVRWIHDRGFQVHDADGALIRIAGIATDITERKQAELALVKSEERFRRYFDLGLVGISIASPAKGYLEVNDELCKILGCPREELLQKTWLSLVHPEEHAESVRTFGDIIAGRSDGYAIERRYVRKDGEVIYVNVSVKCSRLPDGTVDYFVALLQDITGRKRSEAQLQNTQQELLEASRLAGKAEVATNVLHNVGNVLTSINVASQCLAEGLKHSKAANLQKLVALLRQHQGDLPGFFANDPAAGQIPPYLNRLSEHIATEHATALAELASLQKKVEHIPDIVSLQQNYARGSGVAVEVQPAELIDEALNMNLAGSARGGVEVVTDIEAGPSVSLQKHKLLEILVNLIRNAREACLASESQPKKITVRAVSQNGSLRISVADTGTGIDLENLGRIFTRGFTTKKDGHGFGLHGSALAAREMGGSLSVHSDGCGCGAVFTLNLPLTPPVPETVAATDH